jgi:hypothetical protein
MNICSTTPDLRTDQQPRRQRTNLTSGRLAAAVRTVVRITVSREVEDDTEACGHRFQPVRDPQRFPVCPRCRELAGMLWDSD